MEDKTLKGLMAFLNATAVRLVGSFHDCNLIHDPPGPALFDTTEILPEVAAVSLCSKMFP